MNAVARFATDVIRGVLRLIGMVIGIIWFSALFVMVLGIAGAPVWLVFAAAWFLFWLVYR